MQDVYPYRRTNIAAIGLPKRKLEVVFREGNWKQVGSSKSFEERKNGSSLHAVRLRCMSKCLFKKCLHLHLFVEEKAGSLTQ